MKIKIKSTKIVKNKKKIKITEIVAMFWNWNGSESVPGYQLMIDIYRWESSN